MMGIRFRGAFAPGLFFRTGSSVALSSGSISGFGRESALYGIVVGSVLRAVGKRRVLEGGWGLVLRERLILIEASRFVDLLFDFDRVNLRTGGYTPRDFDLALR